MTLDCRYCGESAKLVTGVKVYPHRPDLAQVKFWHCAPCDAWVGVHEGTEIALGLLAKAELRKLKSRVHAAFDPIWKNGHMKRKQAYQWLADGLKIPFERCHVGMFDEDACYAALFFLASQATSEGDTNGQQ